MEAFLRQFPFVLLVAVGMVISQSLMKLGVSQGGEMSLTSVQGIVQMIVRILTTPQLLLGYGLGFVSGLVWLVVLSRINLSLAVPLLTGTYYVLVLLVSTFILRESVSFERLAGGGFILVGLFLLARTGA